MRSAIQRLTVAAASLLMLAAGISAQNYGTEYPNDGSPEITARVARISKLKGDAQVRRRDALEWESADNELPLVEGDELVTSRSSRLEIQFDRNTYLWLDGDAALKIETLSDSGIAVSLPRGSAAIKVVDFDKAQSYFEIDAPATTIALERSGFYRIDAGYDTNDAVLVSALQDGAARVYSQSAGLTLHSGRRARIYVDGQYAGEADTEAISSFDDDFAEWISDREDRIDRDLASSYYGRYYDDDMYGAEDLTDYGQWSYSSSYGYVWRPYGSAISSYANWSPYRYGQWRWLPPYGWTWVNDEPWGWATYHHGRWIWTDGYWAWTPYGYYRSGRSWWRPAVVYMTVYNNNICWYPLPYHYAYYNYNSYYHGHGHGGNNHYPGSGSGSGGHQGGNPTPTPTPGGGTDIGPGLVKNNLPPFSTLPPSGVVAVSRDQFGSKQRNLQPPLNIAKEVVKNVREGVQTSPVLPNVADLTRTGSRPMVVSAPQNAALINDVRTGAAKRTKSAPLDNTLRNDRILGGRELAAPDPSAGRPEPGRRKTGAVERPELTIVNPRPIKPQTEAPSGRPPVRTRTPSAPLGTPREQPPAQNEPRPRTPRAAPPLASPQQEVPRSRPEPRNEPRPQPQPRYEPRPQPQPPASRPREDAQRPQPPAESKPRPSAPLSREKDGKRQ